MDPANPTDLGALVRAAEQALAQTGSYFLADGNQAAGPALMRELRKRHPNSHIEGVALMTETVFAIWSDDKLSAP